MNRRRPRARPRKPVAMPAAPVTSPRHAAERCGEGWTSFKFQRLSVTMPLANRMWRTEYSPPSDARPTRNGR